MKYKEIFKLKKMLEDAGIPFSWSEGWGYEEEIKHIDPDLTERYQICYPVFDPNYRWINIIEGFGTYGAEQDRLEIMGGLTPMEILKQYKEPYDEPHTTIQGGLTARNVFRRIKNHWEKNGGLEK